MKAERDEMARIVSALVALSEPGKRVEALLLGLDAMKAAADIERASAARQSSDMLQIRKGKQEES